MKFQGFPGSAGAESLKQNGEAIVPPSPELDEKPEQAERVL